MINLPSSCHCSELKVHPKNWLSTKASIKKDWYIFYRFYDPAFKNNDKFNYGKLVVLKGMNHFKTVLERQSQTQQIINLELAKLKHKSYNPITGFIIIQQVILQEINPESAFITALELVEKRITASQSTKRDLRSVLNYVRVASDQLLYSQIQISGISRKHLKQILLFIDMIYGESAHRYNKVRSCLMMLFKELLELEAVDTNPLRDISKKKIIQRLRKLPSVENRKLINEHLQQNHYRFWLFMQIFFYSTFS